MKKEKFNGLNFSSLEKLTRDEQRKVVGGYYHNCPGYTLKNCLSNSSNAQCYMHGSIRSGEECCYALCT